MTLVDKQLNKFTGLKPSGITSSPRILAIGDAGQWLRRHGTASDYRQISYAKLLGLDEEDVSSMAPDLILSPVVAKDFDCIDVALALSELGYSGAYRAVARHLPNPGIVTREVRSACPKLDFGILDIDESGTFEI